MDDKGDKDGDTDADEEEEDDKTDLGHKGEQAEAAPGPPSHTLHLGLAVPAGSQVRMEL